MQKFNYVSFGNIEIVKGSVTDFEMGRGRMFEYTPIELAKKLLDLGDLAGVFLGSLPTFLCSEIKAVDKSFMMYIKFGKVSQIKFGQKEVGANFETLVDFDEVRFETLDKAKEIFQADGFQLYRTHWAVKDGDVNTVLSNLVKIKPNLSRPVTIQRVRRRAKGEVKLPTSTKINVKTANSVEKFLELFYSIPGKSDAEVFFRGHDNKNYQLTPSVLRKHPDGAWQFLPKEEQLCKELLIAHYDEFENDEYCFDRLVRMQHYGLPTRLLDITSNPLVALFFACYSGPKPLAVNGEVVILRVASKTIKYYDSDAVSCLSNLSNLSHSQKNEIDLSMDLSSFNASASARKLLHHVRSEKAFFEARIMPADIGSIICVKAKRNNSRIRSQSGAFLLFGHDVVFPSSGTENIEVDRIEVTNKANILRQLDSINVNATTVYPSIIETTIRPRSQYSSIELDG